MIVEEGKIAEVQTAVVQTIYTSALIEQSIKKNTGLQKVVEKVTEAHQDLTGIFPTKIITETIGNKVISQVSYQEQHIISTVVTDVSTGEVEEVSVEPIPVEIKPIILETTVTEEGTTIINTNTVDQVLQYNENFMSILEEMKMAVPMIMTEQILGIRVEVSEDVDAPQKVYVVFETEDV